MEGNLGGKIVLEKESQEFQSFPRRFEAIFPRESREYFHIRVVYSRKFSLIDC
jgi:hypothetical protein